MKKQLLTLIFLACSAIQLLGVECIQVQEADGHNTYWEIKGNTGSMSDARELYIGAPETDASQKMYTGYKLTYLKDKETLILKAISNSFEGFIEIEAGKPSPILTADSKEVVIPAMEGDWITISLKGRKPLKVKWVDIEHSERKI